jgi:hypothetical protein
MSTGRRAGGLCLLARERNLFQTVVPLPCGRLAAAARWGWGRHQAVSRPRLREWRRTGTKCAARPRPIQFSSKLARRHGQLIRGPWAFRAEPCATPWHHERSQRSVFPEPGACVCSRQQCLCHSTVIRQGPPRVRAPHIVETVVSGCRNKSLAARRGLHLSRSPCSERTPARIT